MTTRRRISTKQRLAIFTRHAGRCHICGGQIQATEGWDVSHDRPLELGGADDESNWFPAHRKCHRHITATQDIPRIAKAKRQHASHIGAKRPAGNIKSAPFPKPPEQRRASKSIDKLAGLPRRSMYQEG